MGEKIDPLSTEGRRVLNEIQDRDTPAPPERQLRLDFGYLQSLGHIAGNPFYKEQPSDEAA